MTAHGLPVDPVLARPWFLNEEVDGIHLHTHVLESYLKGALEHGVEAIIGVADALAIQVMQTVQAMGHKVPDEVAVVGYDSFNESRSVTPPLTTVQPSWYDLGFLSVEMLLETLDGKAVDEKVSVSHRLKIRQSCGCVDPSITFAAVTTPAARSKTKVEAVSQAETRSC